MDDIKNTAGMAETAVETPEDLETEPRVYELGYHIIPAISEDKAPAEAEVLKGAVVAAHGVVISEEAPQHVTLAYTMSRTEEGKQAKFDTAHFGSIKFEMNPENIATLTEVLDANKNVLRYLIYKTVRENTRSEVRVAPARGERKSDADTKAPREEKEEKKEEDKTPVSEAELDKSIEELVVE